PINVIPRGEAASENFELVAVANGTEVLLYLDRFDTNAPIVDAAIEVETPEGATKAAQRGGLYVLAAPWLAKQEKLDLAVSVTAGTITDILPVTLDLAQAKAQSAAPSLLDRIQALLEPNHVIAALVGLVLGIFLMSKKRQRRHVTAALITFAV